MAENTKTQAMLDDFVTRLRRRKVDGSLDTAKKTAVLMRQVVADGRTLSPVELLAAVRAAGVRLQEACRTGAGRWLLLGLLCLLTVPFAELSTGNIVRRVLHIIREETASAEADDASSEAADEPASRARMPSLATLLEVHPVEAASPGASPALSAGAGLL